MARLFGREWTREALLERVGSVEQIAGVRLVTLADGKERGVRAAELRTGTGFQFTVLIDRGLDISAAEYCGRPLPWRSMTGDAHPHLYEPEGLGWLRTFYGGLLVTCGLSSFGPPEIDRGQSLGLHGRVSHIPARSVWADGAWDGDEYRFWVRGKVQEAAVFGENLLLTREISARLGENRLLVRDVVENQGYTPAEHMLLYHVNTGFPAVDDGAELISPTREARPRDAAAEQGKEAFARFQAPTAGYQEKVYLHDVAAGPDGRVAVAVANRALEHGVYLRYAQAALPHFIEWKMMGQGHYVVGIEPANSSVFGRAAERERGTLPVLQPGEARSYELEIGVLTTAAEIEALEREVRGWV
jgi:Domain of unknown function (DUF4432)